MIYKIILNFLKTAFYIFSIAIICGFCWVAYMEYTIRKDLEKDRLHYYKSYPFMEQWSNFQKLLMEDIKYRRLDLPTIYDLMEFQDFSIARMDSIMGDSCWRMDNPPMKPRPEDKVLFGVRGDYGLSKPQPIEWNTNTK
jgi:hypothetical protein